MNLSRLASTFHLTGWKRSSEDDSSSCSSRSSPPGTPRGSLDACPGPARMPLNAYSARRHLPAFGTAAFGPMRSKRETHFPQFPYINSTHAGVLPALTRHVAFDEVSAARQRVAPFGYSSGKRKGSNTSTGKTLEKLVNESFDPLYRPDARLRTSDARGERLGTGLPIDSHHAAALCSSVWPFLSPREQEELGKFRNGYSGNSQRTFFEDVFGAIQSKFGDRAEYAHLVKSLDQDDVEAVHNSLSEEQRKRLFDVNRLFERVLLKIDFNARDGGRSWFAPMLHALAERAKFKESLSADMQDTFDRYMAGYDDASGVSTITSMFRGWSSVRLAELANAFKVPYSRRVGIPVPNSRHAFSAQGGLSQSESVDSLATERHATIRDDASVAATTGLPNSRHASAARSQHRHERPVGGPDTVRNGVVGQTRQRTYWAGSKALVAWVKRIVSALPRRWVMWR